MKPLRLLATLLAAAFLSMLAAGCASRDVNPAMARSDRGYVDLFTVPKSDVWWKVDVYDAKDNSYREFTAQFKTPEQSIFRVEAKPGRHKALISFVNRPVEAPAEGEVEVVAGMITPVEVTIKKGDASYVRSVDDRVRSGFATAGRNAVTDSVEERVVISSKALPPIPYAPKAQLNYWK
jgi:hypothetical protein